MDYICQCVLYSWTKNGLYEMALAWQITMVWAELLVRHSSFSLNCRGSAFSALTLLVGRQEGHSACKN